MPPVTRTSIDGIPVYAADIRTAFTGALIFGVGLRDETVRSAGTAHLLEHLVMNRVGRVTVAHNASTSDETIAFYAQGSPALVADFLSRVAQAISTIHEITDSDVAEQRRVIAAELGDDSERHGRGPLLDRFGAQSVGLLDVGSPAHNSVTREEAIAFADTWLHAGNAVLTFSGDVPSPLSVALPAARPLPERRGAEVIRGNAWVPNGPIPVAVSMVLESESTPALLVATTLIADALETELRTKRQLIYSVQPFVAALEKGKRFVCYALDPRPEDAVSTASEALSATRTLALDGPTDERLREELEQWTHAENDPVAQTDFLNSLAESILRGRVAPDDILPPDVSRVTAEDVRAVVASAIPSLFVSFADGTVDFGDESVTTALGLPPVEGQQPRLGALSKMQLAKHLLTAGVESFSPRMFKGLRGSELIVDHDRVTAVDPDGLFEVAFDQVAMASYSQRGRIWLLLARGGDLMVVVLDDWRRSELLHRLLEERLPEEARFIVDAEAAT